MNPLISTHLFEYALNTLWQLPLLAASTWLFIRLVRPSIALQHAFWIATLLLAAALPLRSAVASSSEPHAPIASSYVKDSTPIASPGGHAPLHVIQLTPSLIVHIAQLWALALAFNLLRLAYAWIIARRLIAASSPLDPETLDPAILAMCADLLQIPTPEIRLTTASTPAVAGILNPVLLLPIHLTHHYDLAAVLLHEFAHIRRQDTFANLLCRFVALPIAWHPVTPLLQNRIAQTREILCDALAAQAAGSPTLYARSLITLSQDLLPLTPPPLTQGLFPASSNPSALEERIMTLITPRTLAPANRTMRFATGFAVVLTATAVASCVHLKPAHAQESTPRLTGLAVNPISPPPALEAQVWNMAIKPGAYLQKKDGKTWRLTVASAQQRPTPPSPPQPTAAPAPTPALAPTVPAVHPLSVAPPAPPAAFPSRPAALPAAPQSAPAPEPAHAPGAHARVVVNGVERDLTPQERSNLDKQLAAAQQQIDRAINSGDIAREVANAQKQINSPEFQKEIAEASRIATDKAINSDELRRQLDHAAQQIRIAQADIANQKLDIHIDQAQLQQQLKAASEAITNAKISVHIDTAQIHKQLEEARKQLDEARRNNQQ